MSDRALFDLELKESADCLRDHRKYYPGICGALEYLRTIPDKRQKANDVSDVPAVHDSLRRTAN